MLFQNIFIAILASATAFALPVTSNEHYAQDSGHHTAQLVVRANVPASIDLATRGGVDFTKMAQDYGLNGAHTECTNIRVLFITTGYKCHTTIQVKASGKVYDGGYQERKGSLFGLSSVKKTAVNAAQLNLKSALDKAITAHELKAISN